MALISGGNRLVLSRRRLLQGTAAIGLGVAATGPSMSQAPQPRRGGTFRVALQAGGPTETMDPILANGGMAYAAVFMSHGYLLENAPDGAVVPNLAESWEPANGGKRWVFKIRRGVEFHNGKSLTPADVVYSLNRHRGPDSKSIMRGLMRAVSNIAADGADKVIIDLDSPNADLPVLLGGPQFGIIPENHTDFSKPIGAGGYVCTKFESGVRFEGERHKNFWRTDRAWFDAVHGVLITDGTARLNALLTNRVDAIQGLDRRTVATLEKNKEVAIVRSPNAMLYDIAMMVNNPPFDNKDFRLAMKYAFDREQYVKVICQGFAQVTNDHPVPPDDPYFAQDIPQRKFDPEKAKYHLKKSGVGDAPVRLSTSEAVLAESAEAASLFAQTAAQAGVNIQVVREPAANYFQDIWRKRPFYVARWNRRPTPDIILTILYESTSGSNEAMWGDPNFDKLLVAARGELDQTRRRELYGEMQRICHEDGGLLIPCYADALDGRRSNVMGFAPDRLSQMSGYKVTERAWFAS